MEASGEINQTGQCHCGAVAWKVAGKPQFNGFCHCKNCCRNMGMTPVHLIGFDPSMFEFTKGEDNTMNYKPGEVRRLHCKTCGCICVQGPPTIAAVHPTNFQIEDGKSCMLPKALLPQVHLNYENRLMNYNDELPKFAGFPGGDMMDNEGNVIAKKE